MSEPNLIPSEMSRLVEASRVPAQGLDLTIKASEEERLALAKRFQIPEVRSLVAEVRVEPVGDGFLISGTMKAEVVQSCVLSSHPVEQSVNEAVKLRFSPADEDAQAEVDLADVDLAEIELAEGDLDVLPLEGGVMDVGEAIAETLALALDPYPRASDEAIAEVRKFLLTEEEDRMARSPFAGLAQKRNNPDQKG